MSKKHDLLKTNDASRVARMSVGFADRGPVKAITPIFAAMSLSALLAIAKGKSWLT